MALVGKVEVEVEIESSAERFFNIFRRSAHHLPNICPDKIQGIDLHEGDWETKGSVKQWKYVLDENTETLKETVEAIDEAKKLVTFKVLEGGLTKEYKSLKSTLQVTAKGVSSGGLVKWSIDYEKMNQDVAAPNKYLDFAVSVTKDIDAHLSIKP